MSFEVYVDRENLAEAKGTLRWVVHGEERWRTPCWENRGNLIPQKDYTGCSATVMASKGHKSVYLPDQQTGKQGIFIHPGSSATDSDGCIVCARARIEEIYDTAGPNKSNITVRVTNPA